MIEVHRLRVARGGNCSIARECILFIVYFTTLKVLLSNMMRERERERLSGAEDDAVLSIRMYIMIRSK